MNRPIKRRRHAPASANRLPERMPGGLSPVNASSAAALVGRSLDLRRDPVRLVVGSVFLTDFPGPRRQRGRRILPRTAPRLQRPRNTGETNPDLEDLGALWPDRSRDDALDCSGLGEFFSSEPRPLDRPPQDAWFYPRVGLVTTPRQGRGRVETALPPVDAETRVAPVVDDTLGCDGFDELFRADTDAAPQELQEPPSRPETSMAPSTLTETAAFSVSVAAVLAAAAAEVAYAPAAAMPAAPLLGLSLSSAFLAPLPLEAATPQAPPMAWVPRPTTPAPAAPMCVEAPMLRAPVLEAAVLPATEPTTSVSAAPGWATPALSAPALALPVSAAAEAAVPVVPERTVVVDPPSPYSAFAEDFVKMSRGYKHLSHEIDALLKACGELKQSVQPKAMLCAG